MVYDDDGVRALLELFNLNKKKEIERFCRDLTISGPALTSLILGAKADALAPYKYTNHFFSSTPPDVEPTEKECEALGQSGVGPLVGNAAKFMRKIGQMFEVRRQFAAHLFYTPCYSHWYLFYFDQRDTAQYNNHWEHGPHVHFVSDHWNFKLEDIWNKIHEAETTFSKLHIRYNQNGSRSSVLRSGNLKTPPL